MVFTTTNLFKAISCPEGERCALTSCIFAHDLRPQLKARDPEPALTEQRTPTNEPPPKKRRITYDRPEEKPPSKADLIKDQIAKDRTSPATLQRPVSPPTKTNGRANGDVKPTLRANIPTAAPSARTHVGNTSARNPNKTTKPDVIEKLNPRLVANAPADHSMRSKCLIALHTEMKNLNHIVIGERNKDSPHIDATMVLSDSELIRLALDEEEQLAITHGKVYRNVMTQRVSTYKKKTNVDDWVAHLKTTTLYKAKQPPKPHPGDKVVEGETDIQTGLSVSQEIEVAKHLVIKPQHLLSLTKYGYIVTPPTEEQAKQAAETVEFSKNFENCERCGGRFQVFPNREEVTGRLTNRGPCVHHPNKKIQPQRPKAYQGPVEAYYPCCDRKVGDPGCTESDNHVFKASTADRLAAVMPFINTPENDAPATAPRGGKVVEAVTFDCEMCYTTLGLELIRLTAISWPEGEELIDVLVRPLGIIIDLNSRFSGVWPEDMARATPYTDSTLPPQTASTTSTTPPPLPIVSTPAHARTLLCNFLTPTTPLIGHALENDLNTTRLCHPTLIDTVILYPHHRPLPIRNGLKALSAKHLGRKIQQNDDGRGHDSLEDCRATGDLVRVAVGEKWRTMRREGWSLDGNGGRGLVPPKDGGAGQKKGLGKHQLTEEYLEDGK